MYCEVIWKAKRQPQPWSVRYPIVILTAQFLRSRNRTLTLFIALSLGGPIYSSRSDAGTSMKTSTGLHGFTASRLGAAAWTPLQVQVSTFLSASRWTLASVWIPFGSE